MIEAKVLSVQQIPKGSKALLDDASGRTIAMVVWDTVREKMQDQSAFAAGRIVRVIGKVGEYKGELQITPEEGWDLTAKGG